MIRLPQWSMCAVLLTGCASFSELPMLEPDVPSGAPWGLAWIPASGEVAIKAGAVEHVLYPDAAQEKPGQARLNPLASAARNEWESKPPSRPIGSRALSIRRGKAALSPRTSELRRQPVPAQSFFESVPPANEFGALARGACAIEK